MSEYHERLMLAQRKHPELFKGGTIAGLDVEHDAPCRKLVDDHFSCNCTPNVVLVVGDRRYNIAPDGTAAELLT